LVMEFVEGKTLRGILKSGPLPIRQVLEIAIQVADALSLADEKGIIHRDIKSENIMLTDRGQVKVLDFGLAKMMEKSGPAAHDAFQTVGDVVLGPVSYMSPEQALGAKLDGRTDIYSTGVVLFEMLTATMPFTGTSPSVVLAKVLNQPPPPVTEYNAAVPPSLQKVIAKCLEKNRDQRYQNALSFLVDLRAIKREAEQTRDWSGTVMMQPAKDLPLTPPTAEKLGDLVPTTAPLPSSSGSTVALRESTVSATPSVGGAPASFAAVGIGGLAAMETVARKTAGPGRTWRLGACFLLKTIQRAVATAAGLYALACVALFVLPKLRPEFVIKVPGIPWLHSAVDPVQTAVASAIDFNLTYSGLNFLLLGLALGAYILQSAVCWPLGWLESWIRKPLLEPLLRPQMHGSGVVITTPGMSQASRMSLLREYAASKRILSDVKKEMAFLALDVAGSTKMKAGEEKLAIEHAFAEYKKFLERIFRECRVYKVAWTPDGTMSAFFSVEDATTAARKLLEGLSWFNRDTHQLRTKFQVRCGLNVGEVLFPEDKPLEEISDEVIDVAGHLQKYADPDTLWISAEAYNQLVDRSGFAPTDRQVDNHDVYVWRQPS
ncbi:MAG: protein kinase, partial [Acidobacteria bacterium]|nr:protein kinase [Acidobacteriota bacterium]